MLRSPAHSSPTDPTLNRPIPRETLADASRHSYPRSMKTRRFSLSIALAFAACTSTSDQSGDDAADEAGSEDTSEGGEDTGGEPSYEIDPPQWLLGMWSGTASDATPKVAVFNAADISFGDLDGDGAQLDMTSFAAFPLLDPKATFELGADDGETYSYTITFDAGQGEMSFTDTFERISDDEMSYRFELGGMVVDEFTMTRTPAGQFIVPPAWLHGRWEGTASDNVDKVAVISASAVRFGDIIDGQDDLTDFGMLLGIDSQATYQVLSASDETDRYVYKITINDPDNGLVEFTDEYTLIGEDTLEYGFTLGAMEVDRFEMVLVP